MSNDRDVRWGSDVSVAVIGAGAWGTTLANLLAESGRDVTLIAHSQDHADALRASRENVRYLPGVTLDSRLQMTADMSNVASAALVLIVVPAQRVRSVAEAIRDAKAISTKVVCAAKGLELGTLSRMSQVIIEAAALSEEQVCVMSGPNLAGEIARGLPATTVVACADPRTAQAAQLALATPTLRIYTSGDVIGVELGGALKNIVALGAGAVDGMGLGHNAKAALMTRGLAEMIRLGVSCGANPLTFGGLSGLGDLVATCESPLSRNRTFGERLGRGQSIAEAFGGSPHVVEGLTTARAALKLARARDVEMPIAETVVNVLDGRLDVRAAIGALMSREVRPELDGPR